MNLNDLPTQDATEELRIKAALVLLEAFAIGGHMNSYDPSANMMMCWRLADQFVDAGIASRAKSEKFNHDGTGY